MEIPDTSLQQIIDYLTGRIGLDPDSIGKETVERAVRKRIQAVHATSAESYFSSVQSFDGEMERLVEAVAVPETWFFRDASVFSFLPGWVSKEWKPAYASSELRILSLPCSSGEEPYSICMALLDSGFPADRLDIEGIDLRELALERARRGLYSRNSFRSGNLDFQERYFNHVKEGFQIRDLPFERIRFRPGNLLDPGLLDSSAYDIIFCRNLLIYFDLQAKRKALTHLRRALRSGGIMFVGHSETLWVSSQPGFSIVPEPHVFAVQQSNSLHSRAGQKPIVPVGKKSAKRVTATAPSSPPARRRASEPVPDSISMPPAPDLLTIARECANRGDQAGARAAVDESVQRDGPTAEAFLLLGLLSNSEGRHDEAARLFEKALYLRPAHEEALTLLALEKERGGNRVAARHLRDRLKRAGAGARKGERA